MHGHNRGGTIMYGHNRGGTIMYGHKRIWAQTYVCGCKRVWDSHVGTIMYGHKRSETELYDSIRNRNILFILILQIKLSCISFAINIHSG